MNNEVLLTQEVGSLAKPNWRVAAAAGNLLTSDHVTEAVYWSNRLGLDADEAEAVIGRAITDQSEQSIITEGSLREIKDLAAKQAVELQVKAGLDIVYDGEQDRSEMYQHAASRTLGLQPRGRVRVFDNKTYKTFAVVDEPAIERPWHAAEVERLHTLTTKQIKVPITGAYTLADWSFDERFGDRRELVLALARNVIRPNIAALLEQGIEWVQIDEPAAGTKAREIDLFVESFNASTSGLLGKFSIHLCFSDWKRFIPYIKKLENCHQLSIEFANRDGKELGVTAEKRPSYEVLKEIATVLPATGIGLGVVSIHEDQLESPLLIRDRILRAVELLGDPAKVFPSPDCGLRTRSWAIAYEKLARTVAGAQLARQELGL